ncbi:mucoidy inhibitor MuiA family protein [Cellulophaga sp. E16_2]|uniref:DUF4139 domain-containing protein n=1 Tax=Cellulophaga sp. E16_2 TaxID=2789297 RepID=UPI001A92DFFA|nr:DUF4139 domain-containing protein [Cellulophaga sp. E16_2]MBO0593459.1 mucoidy inhibitor MuiA family protein [Cellulophaga sp. E16_2]
MKHVVLFLIFCPMLIFGTDKVPSKIKSVTVYLNSAEISRASNFQLAAGTTELIFNGLSPKIDESSIQISGLKGASILSISYDINYLDKIISSEATTSLIASKKTITLEIALLKNLIIGLEEEEKVINSNRAINVNQQSLDLEAVKQISTYYRNRITEIKNEIYITNVKINVLSEDLQSVEKQYIELNNVPDEPKGEIVIKLESPIATQLNLELKYKVSDAGWIPNYDLKSNKINDPIHLTYKAHVYQKTGENWDNVLVTLSTGNPNSFSVKPELTTDYLNFGSRKSYDSQFKKHKYSFNPTVKKVIGIVTDASGQALPGCNVMIKGTNIGTQTDFDGHYILAIEAGQELVFSYLGFQTIEIPIYSSVMNARLQEDSSALEEIVVVGYGSQNKELGSALSGRVAGVSIRGVSSVTEASQPLYIIDGVPMDTFEEGDLDANEILNIEVLKDASAASVYGARATNGVIRITTKKSNTEDNVTSTKFVIKSPYSIASDGDVTAIEINTFLLEAVYEFYAAPIVNENVFLTAKFKDWEKLNLLPGEANIYFNGGYAGKTTIDPYAVNKEMTVSLGVDAGIVVTRKQDKNFKSKSFTGSNRIVDRTYNLEVKNNKSETIKLVLMDRIPISENKEIKIEDIIVNTAAYDEEKGLLTWELEVAPKQESKHHFSFQVKYPKGRSISL